MKVRHGFVSNSSSSSFCIYGSTVDEVELYKILKDIAEKEIFNRYRFNTYYPPSLDFSTDTKGMKQPIALGVSFTAFDEDKTIRQMKEEIREILQRWFGKDLGVDIWEEGWYDG